MIIRGNTVGTTMKPEKVVEKAGGDSAWERIDIEVVGENDVRFSNTFEEIHSMINDGKIPYLYGEMGGSVYVIACAEANEEYIMFAEANGLIVTLYSDGSFAYKSLPYLSRSDVVNEIANDGGSVDVIPSELAVANFVNAKIGDVSSALDSIIAMQEELIGGDS